MKKQRKLWMLLGMLVFCFALGLNVSAAVKLNKSKVTLWSGKTAALKVLGTSKKAKWSSSKKSVATVSGTGKVTAKKAGTAVITANVKGKVIKCGITVKKPSVKLNKSKATIYTSGTKTVQLKATVKGPGKKVTWKSSNKSVATVNSKGKVTAKKAGTVTITAKANGVTAKCTVTVKKKKAAAKTSWKSLYKSFLTKNSVSVRTMDGYTESVKLKGCYFTSVDINQDGVNELVLKEAFGSGSSSMPCSPITYVFTVKNGKVKYAGSVSLKQDYSKKVYISKKYKSIYSSYGVSSYLPEHYYTIKNGRFSEAKFFYAQYGYGWYDNGVEIAHESWCSSSGYYIDKKKVSESEFYSESSKYSNSLVTYTLRANTAGNRKKSFG